MTSLDLLLHEQAPLLGYLRWGSSPLKKPLTFEQYKSWLTKNFHGEMTYLYEHLPLKENPEKHFSPFQTVLSFTFPYSKIPTFRTHDFKNNHNLMPLSHPPFKRLRISLYAHGEDYHFFIREQLGQLILHLKKQFPREDFLAFTDSAPLLERAYAHQSGLGWIGKNTCLIDRKSGSLFFLAEILTTMSQQAPALANSETINEQKDFKNYCGSCQRCVDICPTQALKWIDPPTHAPADNFFTELDATKCISYLTIESKTKPPLDLRKKMGDWFFGCDLCQTVCPWNQKTLREGFYQELQPSIQGLSPLHSDHRAELVEDLRFILQSSNKKLQSLLKSSPLSRARGNGLKRNALIVAANHGLDELIEDIQEYFNHKQLGELAQWACNQISINN